MATIVLAFFGSGHSFWLECVGILFLITYKLANRDLVTFLFMVYRICWIMPSVLCPGTAIGAQGVKVKREWEEEQACIDYCLIFSSCELAGLLA